MCSQPRGTQSLPDMKSQLVTLQAVYKLVKLNCCPIPYSQRESIISGELNADFLCGMKSCGVDSNDCV